MEKERGEQIRKTEAEQEGKPYVKGKGEPPYRLRAHHGLCLCFFRGKGYSKEFVQNMTEIKKQMEKDPVICVIGKTDVICGSCPNRRGEHCRTEEKVCTYDGKVMEYCQLKAGEQMPYTAFARLVRENILIPGRRREICGDCAWDGICLEAEKSAELGTLETS